MPPVLPTSSPHARRAPVARARRRTKRSAVLAMALALAIAASACGTADPTAGDETPTGPAGPAATLAPATTLPPRPTIAAPKPATPVTLATGDLAPVLSRVPTTDKVIFLTIDDGLVRDPAALDVLIDEGIPFSNFLNTAPAMEGTEFWRRAQAEGGAAVEGHTATHPDLKKLGAEQQRKEMCGQLDLFEEMFGRRPTLFRPPFGNYNDSVRRVAASCGYQAVVMWAGSTNNGKLTMQAGKLQPGDIVLMHWRDDLVDNLADVVAQCEAAGFKIARLEDYLPPGR